MKSLFDGFFPEEVLTLVSDRSVDFTLRDVHSPLTIAQARYLAAHAGRPIERLFNFRQVHGRRVLFLSEKNIEKVSGERLADGVITAGANVPLTVRTADCLSIFLYDKKHRGIGLIHAGWQGTRKKIVLAALGLMQKKFGTKPKDVLAAFGPSIKTCCYQVGKEFFRIFPQAVEQRHGSWYLNLLLVNQRHLLEAGLKRRQIFDCGLCTGCSPRFFSYRREGERAGRMLSLMMLRE